MNPLAKAFPVYKTGQGCVNGHAFAHLQLSLSLALVFDTVLVDPKYIPKRATISVTAHAHLDPPQAELKALRLEAFSDILINEMGFQDFTFFAKYKVGGDKSACMRVDNNRKCKSLIYKGSICLIGVIPCFNVGAGLRGGLVFCLKTILALNHCLNHFDSAFKQ